MTCSDMLDRIVASQDEFCIRILSASEDLPPTYATLKKLGVADQMRGDILFARTWRDNGCEPEADGDITRSIGRGSRHPA